MIMRFFKKCAAKMLLLIVTFAAGVLLGLAPAVMAQMTVISISPAHGSINVATNAVIAITFSAALDTSFRFGDIDLPVNVELHPDSAVAAPDAISFSADLRTIQFHNMGLAPDTRFVLLVTGARSQAGAPLSRPATATFSTGATLPGGSIGGTVSYSGGANGAIVGIFAAGFASEVAGYAVAENNGSFTVPFLPGGNYFALSIKDANLDGDINPGNGDPLGGYDPNNDKLVDGFALNEGGNLAGINITLRDATPQTARALFSPTVENLAKAVDANAQLVTLAAEYLAVDGKSTFWNYLFYSPATRTNFGFAGNGDIFFPAFDFREESDTLDVPLPPDWIDSKVAMDSAQARLGEAFLQQYPNAKISGIAGLIDFGSGGGLATRSASPFDGKRKLGEKQNRHPVLNKAGTASQQQAWLISYIDEASAQFAFILLDVRTGATLSIFWPRMATASNFLPIAMIAAQSWAADAALVMLAAPLGADFSPVEGTAIVWHYLFYSASKDSLQLFFVVNGILFGQEEAAEGPQRPIPPGWIDSNIAGPIAEALGGEQYRQSHPEAVVEAYLGYVNPAEPDRVLWGFNYVSFIPQLDTLTIYVNAFIIDDVSERPMTPNGYALRPTFPNPVQPGQSAQWSFYTPTAVEAHAEIYNILGQKVAQIFNRQLSAGESLFHWDGRLANGAPATSGTYFVRLEYHTANGEWQVFSRPLLLRK
jgi:hypothetical protein